MEYRRSKILVVGAGAVGGITAAFLVRAGYDVEILCRSQELTALLRSYGLHVYGVKGEHRVRLRAITDVSEMDERKDVVLMATKANDLASAARRLLPFLTESSIVVSMQNGICEYALADIIGVERTVGCIVGWGATMHNPGELEMTSKGRFIVGSIGDESYSRLETIKNILISVAPTTISNNYIGDLYAKFIINSCITSLGAISGLYLGEMLRKRNFRKIATAVIRECIAVTDVMGIKVGRLEDQLDYYKFLEGKSIISDIKRHIIILAIGYKYRRLRSSSLQSLERRRETEIDYLNGYISAMGKQYNVPTPINDRIVHIIKDIEAGRRKISMMNLNAPFFNNL
jgi:2-dehydropantoate 2-reductase